MVHKFSECTKHMSASLDAKLERWHIGLRGALGGLLKLGAQFQGQKHLCQRKGGIWVRQVKLSDQDADLTKSLPTQMRSPRAETSHQRSPTLIRNSYRHAPSSVLLTPYLEIPEKSVTLAHHSTLKKKERNQQRKEENYGLIALKT